MNIQFLATFGILGILFAFPLGASAQTHTYYSSQGHIDFHAQGGMRYVDYSVSQTSNHCSIQGSQVIGCQGTGQLEYTDYNNNSYVVDTRYVSGNGNNVYFAGEVVSSNLPDQVGNWLYASVNDSPRSIRPRPDQVYGTFMNADLARERVAQHAQPDVGPYYVNAGNLEVRKQQLKQRRIPTRGLRF